MVPNSGTTDRVADSRIADALFGNTQRRVLAALFANAERSYYLAELFAITQSGHGAVQRELKRLVHADLVTVEQRGNQKHYQANRKSPVFQELQALVLKTTGFAGVLRTALSNLAPRIRIAFVYGSLAKQSERARSDVDLFIVSDDLEYADLYEAIGGAEHVIGRTINPQIFSTDQFVMRRQNEQAFVSRVMAQPKIWLIGKDDELAS